MLGIVVLDLLLCQGRTPFVFEIWGAGLVYGLYMGGGGVRQVTWRPSLAVGGIGNSA